MTSWWEIAKRIALVALGAVFLVFCVRSLMMGNLLAAATTFSMTLLTWAFANLTRFKRIKGFGLEAELWEEKQEEADQIIMRFKKLIEIYTKELMIRRVMSGRWSSDPGWQSHWDMYDQLVAHNDALNSDMDWRDLKGELDAIFTFDMVSRVSAPIVSALKGGKQDAQQEIRRRYGEQITDIEGHSRDLERLRDIEVNVTNPFEYVKNSDLAERMIETALNSAQKLERDFDVKIEIPPSSMEKLRSISAAWKKRPISVSPELIALSKHDKERH